MVCQTRTLLVVLLLVFLAGEVAGSRSAKEEGLDELSGYEK